MSHHVVPQKIYFLVFATLLCLTLITVDVAFYNFGWLNMYIALAIATIKATVIVLYFMHVKFSSRLIWIFAVAGLFWLVILFTLTFGDYLTRF
jgi:cytochrome c oxidase subunit IV